MMHAVIEDDITSGANPAVDEESAEGGLNAMTMTSLTSHRARLLCSTGLAVAGAMFAATAAYAQESQTLETVVITGSRLAVSTAFDAPTPVAVVGSEDIKLTGTVNMEGLLSQSPQFTAATNGGATANTVQANGDSGAAYLNQRALGAARNLVLVNGRRFAIQSTSLITDINTIPTALIQRTEIVTGGSSAVYGSDAVAGVTNFIMKRDFEGVEASGQYTFDQFTNSPTYNFDLVTGGNFDHDKGNVVVALNYSSRKGFTQPDHGGWTNVQYTDACVTSGSYSPTNPGVKMNGTSGAACVASGGKMGFVAGGSGDTPNGYIKGITVDPKDNSQLAQLYAAAGLSGLGGDGMIFGNAGTPSTVRVRDSSVDTYNLIATNYMQVPQQRWMMNSFAHYDFNRHFKSWSEFHFSSNTVSAQLTPANASGSMIVNVHDAAFSPALQSLFNYFDTHETGTTTVTAGTGTFTTVANDGKAAVQFGKRFAENGMRRQDAQRVAYRFAGGFNGEIGSIGDTFLKDLTYDVYYTYAHTQETDTQSGSLSRSKLQQLVLSPVSTDAAGNITPVCEVFGIGALSQSCINQITVQSEVVTVAEMQGAQASISGTAFDLPAGPVQFAVGTEWRYTMAQYIPDMSTRTGDIAGLNSAAATKGSTVVHEAFGEMRIPVVSDLPFVERFTVNAAFRESGYNLKNAKGVLTWSSGADWKVDGNVTVRGQYQRSIRAPNVNELFGGLLTNYNGGIVDPCGALSTTQTAAVRAVCEAQGVASSAVFTSAVQGNNQVVRWTQGGNPNLRPEKSDTITLGGVFTPEFVPGLAVSLDFYSISIRDAIASLGGGAQGVLASCYSPTGGGAPSASSPYCQNIVRVNGNITDGYVATSWANISSQVTRGLDFASTYSFALGAGLLSDESRLDVSANYSYLLTYRGKQISDPAAIECAGTYGNTGCAWEPLPYFKGQSRFTWHDGPLSLSLRWRMIGGVQLDKFRRGLSGTSADNYTRPYLPDMHYFDVSANYDINEYMTVYGGINNLLSKDPPIIGSAQSYANSLPATYDSFGRVTFIGITARTN
jgi:Outer membrane cobalamin receptor protein